MVSLRRRRLLGQCSDKSPFPLTSLPLYCEHLKPDSGHPKPSKDRNSDKSTGAKRKPSPSTEHGSSLATEQPQKWVTGPPIKRRKQHRRKNSNNQEPYVMRGVYLKNGKWQAAIKVDKKQIHLGTVSSQEEAAHLYDRAAFMCKREPNFEISEEEKQELTKFTWDEFLTATRQSINEKRLKRWQSEMPPLQDGEWDDGQELYAQSTLEDAEGEECLGHDDPMTMLKL